MYYHADEYGDPDFSRPFSHEERVEFYRSDASNDPLMLADLYLDFHDFSMIQFLLFKDRLSSAILLARSAEKEVGRLGERFEQQRRCGSHHVPGWEGESDIYLDESIGITQDAHRIAIGAAILTAVAALELLLKELSQNASNSSGFSQALHQFLEQQGASSAEKERITEMTSKVRQRRNLFAHTLTGSYWDQSRPSERFTQESLEDTLFTVAKIAIALEGLTD